MQEQDGQNRVIQYISHQFSEQKQKWPTIEREAFAINFSLEKLHPIIIGTDITVYTDHRTTERSSGHAVSIAQHSSCRRVE